MRQFIIYTIIALIVFNPFVLAASETDSSKSGEEKREKKKEDKKEEYTNDPFLKALVKDAGHILSAPARINRNNWFLWVGTIAATGILIHNDEAIYKEFKSYQKKNKWVDKVSPHITKFGTGEYNIGIAGGFFLGGLLLKDRKAKETAKLIIMTYLQTGLVVQIGKHMFGRQRPSWDNGKDKWHGPSGFFDRYKAGKISKYDAFPSGHTITVMGTAAVISEMYKDTVWVPVLSYTMAGLVGLSRVTEDTHWLSEIVLSTVLGIAIGKYVVKRRNRMGRKINIMPMVGTNKIGLSLSYTL